MKQLTLDGGTARPKKRFKEDYKKCSRKWCPKIAETGSELCLEHGIDHVLNYHYGLDEYIIPQVTGWSAHEYYQIRRRQQFTQLISSNL